MNNSNQKKSTRVPLPIRVPQERLDELDSTAREKGISRTKEADLRLANKPVILTPELLVNLQDKANVKYNELFPDMPEEAEKLLKEVARLWNSLA